MSKSLFLSVNCTDSFASGVPETFSLELDEKTLERIHSLAKTVEQAGAYRIDKFFYEGAWSTETIDEMELEGIDFEGASDLAHKRCEAHRTAVDIPMLQVTATGFLFTAVPKHGSVVLTTEKVYFDNMANTMISWS